MFELRELIRVTKAKLINRQKNISLCSGISTDSRTINEGEVFFALVGNNFDGHNFIKEAIDRKASAVVISKDIGGVNVLKVSDTTIALGDFAKYYRKKQGVPLIAVTGSSGKTTTKDIIAHILAKKFGVLKNFGTHNNQIGVPETIFKLNNTHKLCVLELGTNHFGEISYLSKIAQPNIAVITNIGASHLEAFKDLRGVLGEKRNILNYLAKPKIALLNADDLFLSNIKEPKGVKVFYFGINQPSDFMASDISIEDNRAFFIFNKKHKLSLQTVGRFNIYNALIGIGCGLIFGLSLKKIKQTLEDFGFPKNRFNKITCSKFTILDDTYNSNPLSLKNAIESLIEFKAQGKKILVMGDMLELGDESANLHRQIGRFVSGKPIDMVVTLGGFSKIAAEEAALATKDSQEIASFSSKEPLIDFLRNKIGAGDTLLIKGSRLMKMEEIVSSLTNAI